MTDRLGDPSYHEQTLYHRATSFSLVEATVLIVILILSVFADHGGGWGYSDHSEEAVTDYICFIYRSWWWLGLLRS